MTTDEIRSILDSQRALFASGVTLEYDYRYNALGALYDAVASHEKEIMAALHADLGKSETESYMCEIGLLLSDIRYLRRNLRSFMKPKRRRVGLTLFPGHGELRRSPYGVTLIMSPWNYPLLLLLEPLAASLAAGNTAVLKPSAYAPESSAVIAKLIGETFTPDYVACVTGGRSENTSLLAQRWDKIFFTGGSRVGREVLRSAAENLTPVALELGGKSPVIIDDTADIRLAAKRIVSGKFLNCGQTCVAPDYVLCFESVHDAFIDALRAEVAKQYPNALRDNTYGHIITSRHFERIVGLIDPAKVIVGGRSDAMTLKIEPTVMDGVTPDDAVMGEEIFGPVLPVLTCSGLDEAIEFIESRPRPLALYIFTRSRENEQKVLTRCRFGGGCVNDTIMHLVTDAIPFGGVGESGMGAYHGRWGFEEFTHLAGIYHRTGARESSVRFHPYPDNALRMLRKLLH